MNRRIDAERILDAYLAPESDRLPDRVLDAALADIARTPQRRALRVPWRFPTMPALSRATGIAAVALVAVVGAGGLIYLNSSTPGRPGGSASPRPPSDAPSVAPTPEKSQVALGINAWTQYTSEIYGFTVGYPDDWDSYPATREWKAGDRFADATPWAETFASPDENGDDQVGVWIWEVPAGEGADLESVEGLETWAATFCEDLGDSSCVNAPDAIPMCLDAGGDSCRSAIIVPAAEGHFAFFGDWSSAMLTSVPDVVRVVTVGRPDDHPSTEQYGGAAQLLKSILTTMDVTTPQPGETPGD